MKECLVQKPSIQILDKRYENIVKDLKKSRLGDKRLPSFVTQAFAVATHRTQAKQGLGALCPLIFELWLAHELLSTQDAYKESDRSNEWPTKRSTERAKG